MQILNRIVSNLKLVFFSLVFSSSFTVTHGQFAIEWQKCAGGSQMEQANSICTTYDGGYVIAGISHSVDGDAIGNITGGQVWIVKLSEDGNIIWQKNHGTANMNDQAFSISETFDHGFIIASQSIISSNPYGDIIKLDSLGNFEWQQQLSSIDYGGGYSAVQASDSSFLYGGARLGGVTSGNYDYQVVKIDSMNAMVWTVMFGGTGSETCKAVTETVNGAVMTLGQTSSDDGDVSANIGGNDIWVIKLDSLGQMIWEKCYGSGSSDQGADIHKTADGGFIGAGTCSSNSGQVTGNHGDTDYWVFKIDSAGVLLWSKSLGGSTYDQCKSIDISPSGNIAVAGYTNSKNGDVLINYGSSDGWIAILDSAGNLIDQITIGSTLDDYLNDIKFDNEENLLVTGYTSANNIDVSGYNGGVRDTWTVKLNRNFNNITGKTFADLNSDLIHDSGETAVANIKISDSGTGRFSFTNNSGNYSISVFDTATYDVLPVNMNPYFTNNPSSHNIIFNGFHQVDSLNDFALQPAGTFNDLCIEITPTGPFRPGFNGSYLIKVENKGTTTINNGVVTLYTDANLMYVSSTSSPALVTNDSITFNITALGPFENNQFLVTLSLNSGTPIGTIISSSVKVEPLSGDANPACNFSTSDITATGSFDPNDITVDRDSLYTFEFPNPPLLEYRVRFQNTGSDTAFTVVIINNLDENVDPASLQLTTTSHPVQMSYEQHSRKLKFTFENILLPDDNTDEPGSHGFVRYMIRPLNTLQAGDSIKSIAAIYFDFNAPVITNTAVTEVVLPTGINSPVENELYLYPNPAKSELNIRSDAATSGTMILIYDLYGKEIINTEFSCHSQNNLNETKIDVSSLSSGIYFIRLVSNEKNYVQKWIKL